MKNNLKLPISIVLIVLLAPSLAITATASSTGQGSTSLGDLYKQGSYDSRPVRTITAYGPTADISIFGVGECNYEIRYYPKAKGTEIVEIRNESLYYYDKIGSKEFYWSDNGAGYKKFTQGNVYYGMYTKTTLNSRSSNICYLIRLGVPPLPDGAAGLTFHVKIHP